MWVDRLSHGLCYLIDTVAEPQKLAPVGLRAAGLLAVELCAPVGAQLVELRVKRLAVDADNGRIRGFAGLFRSYLLQTVPLEDIGSRVICKSLDGVDGCAGRPAGGKR
jgi:hypothetical protein